MFFYRRRFNTPNLLININLLLFHDVTSYLLRRKERKRRSHVLPRRHGGSKPSVDSRRGSIVSNLVKGYGVATLAQNKIFPGITTRRADAADPSRRRQTRRW
jgi:hypothetical protein